MHKPSEKEPVIETVIPESVVTVKKTVALLPPTDTWERIRRGLQLSEIEHPRIIKEIKRYNTHRPTLQALLKRSTPYLYFIVEEIEKVATGTTAGHQDVPTEDVVIESVEIEE